MGKEVKVVTVCETDDDERVGDYMEIISSIANYVFDNVHVVSNQAKRPEGYIAAIVNRGWKVKSDDRGQVVIHTGYYPQQQASESNS